jgi:D-cysteine desulfhydrase family pyridoxal phosphate-dependent enzyme
MGSILARSQNEGDVARKQPRQTDTGHCAVIMAASASSALASLAALAVGSVGIALTLRRVLRASARHVVAKSPTAHLQRARAALGAVETYEPPAWARSLPARPLRRVVLGLLPTPLVRLNLPTTCVPEGFRLWIKRDDLSGLELSGNKVRKLEFLLCEALQQGCDCVVTAGGIQSNHCRATAVAARALGLEPHLVLRSGESSALSQTELASGNLLWSRLVDARIWLVTRDQYRQHGSVALLERVATRLRSEGRKPFVIPVGGSNWLGTWGYVDFVAETMRDAEAVGVTDVAMACGSGGTTAGIALGAHLSDWPVKVHAFGVCDSPEYFYEFIERSILSDGARLPPVRRLVDISDAKGLGYALSTDEELNFIANVAAHSGIVLDPVYSGKALLALTKKLRTSPEAFRGRDVLFVHTGGFFALYAQGERLVASLPEGRVRVLEES